MGADLAGRHGRDARSRAGAARKRARRIAHFIPYSLVTSKAKARRREHERYR
jgi:hypothetical protein